MAKIHSGQLVSHRETLSPGCMPTAINPFATRSVWADTAAKVKRCPSKQIASRSPKRRAISSGSDPSVRFANQSPMMPPRQWTSPSGSRAARLIMRALAEAAKTLAEF